MEHAAPTISVVGHDGGELRIPRELFDNPPEGTKYKEWSDPSAPVDAKSGKGTTKRDGKPKAGTNPERTLSVVNKDDRFFIADGNGEVITDDERFDHENGYPTDVDAWTATTAD